MNYSMLFLFSGYISTQQPNQVVGFHVALDHQQSTAGKVAFNKVLSNYENGWNNSSYTFRVPTRGLYFLTLTVMNHGTSPASATLMRGSDVLQQAYATGGHSFNSDTTSTVLLLNEGDEIYAKHGRGTLHSHGTYFHTHLAGFLIQATRK